MAQITRSTKIGGGTTLQSNTLARAADVETDILTLFSHANNLDTATEKHTAVSVEGSATVPLTVNNSTGTQNIANLNDNGTNVLSVADGGTTTITANGGSNKALIANNGTSTGNIFEAQDNGTAQVTVADGGTITLAPGGTTKVVINSSSITLSNSETIAMGSAKITGLAAGSTNGDAVRYEQLHLRTTYTPTFSAGWGTVTSVTVGYTVVGKMLFVNGTFTTGTVAGSVGTITLPSGLTIDTTGAVSRVTQYGLIYGLHSGANANLFANSHVGNLIYDGSNTDRVEFSDINGGGGNNFGSRNVSSMFGSTERVSFSIVVPLA